jgi:hypothetical protein
LIIAGDHVPLAGIGSTDQKRVGAEQFGVAQIKTAAVSQGRVAVDRRAYIVSLNAISATKRKQVVVTGISCKDPPRVSRNQVLRGSSCAANEIV